MAGVILRTNECSEARIDRQESVEILLHAEPDGVLTDVLGAIDHAAFESFPVAGRGFSTLDFGEDASFDAVCAFDFRDDDLIGGELGLGEQGEPVHANASETGLDGGELAATVGELDTASPTEEVVHGTPIVIAVGDSI